MSKSTETKTDEKAEKMSNNNVRKKNNLNSSKSQAKSSQTKSTPKKLKSNASKTESKRLESTTEKSKVDSGKQDTTNVINLKKRNLGLIVTVCVLATLLAGVSILYGFSLKTANGYALDLEDIYQKNFYDLVDNVNNAENKLAKTLSSTDEVYQAKMLEEISKNANMAQEKLNNLPYSVNGLDESISFVNQVSGYADTLSKDLKNGKKLTSSEHKTLENIYDSILVMKESLNKMSKNMWDGYRITKTSSKMNGDFNNFTNDMKSIKQNEVDYPTMIYDGPFSDSQTNRKVKGLSENDVNESQAKQNLLKIFSDYTDNMVKFENDTKGNFETYNYIVKLKEEDKEDFAYIQMTKKGGHLLTATAFNDGQENGKFFENFKSSQVGKKELYDKNRLIEGNTNKSSKNHPEEQQQNKESQLNNEIEQDINQKINQSKKGKKGKNINFQNQDSKEKGKDVKLTMENAKSIALDFAKKNNLENMKVVWSDRIGGNAFINLAPIQNNIILYPDLVKAKVDLTNGTILGWEAKGYYMNHVDRNLQKDGVSLENARNKIGKKFVIMEENLALIPLEFGGEVLCYEFHCKYGGDDYYIYINTSQGKEEKILKVIETDNGSLLL